MEWKYGRREPLVWELKMKTRDEQNITILPGLVGTRQKI